jgi:hypothetical protein
MKFGIRNGQCGIRSVAKVFPEIPPGLPFTKGGAMVSPFGKGRCEKIRIEKATACLVVQGTAKIYLPKIGGKFVR